MSDNETFADLPDALVRDLLHQADRLGGRVHDSISALALNKGELRARARDQKLLLQRADLDVVREPSVAGIDGSYQVHRLMSMDLCAAAAVGVEGTAREERRTWKEPYHRLFVETVQHSADTPNAIRGITVSMELELAGLAPHDLVLLDGSFSPLVIYLNQGRAAREAPKELRERMADGWTATFDSLISALSGNKIVALPKYATRNELGVALGSDPEAVDGKTLATTILEPGEYTAPLRVFDTERDRDYHISGLDKETEAPKLAALMRAVEVIYFRPYSWLPAVRIELPGNQASDLTRRAMVLEGIARQLFTPAVFEPYPTYLADRMVRSLGAGVTVLELAINQHVADNAHDIEGALMLLRQYRTEGGRGS